MSIKTIALVGQPNSGKSTLFNVLSDIKTSTSNFAGTTVQISETEINHNGETFLLVDLPGTYSLNPSDKAEEVTLDYLLNKDIDIVINVINSALLARSLELTVELIELGLPMVIALNMQDESENLGIAIDPAKLEEIFNVPVVPTTSLYGKGVKQLLDQAAKKLRKGNSEPIHMKYTHHFEVQIEELTSSIQSLNNNSKIRPRFWALKSLEFPEIVDEKILKSIYHQKMNIEFEIKLMHGIDAFESISYERHHLAMKISEKTSQFKPRKQRKFKDKLDDYLLHPKIGHIFLALFFGVYFITIFVVGNLISGLLEHPLSLIPHYYEPLRSSNLFLWRTIDGAFQGLSGALGIVMPYFLPLVFLTSIFEDSGYLARVAFLIDGVMHRIGLHGKSVVAFILGFGCTVPAIYATRILENKRDRIISGILIPFIPCSARISVIFALAAAFTGPIWAIVIFLFVLLVIAVNGKILSKFIDQPMGLILEIPSLKTPSIRSAFNKTWIRTKEFLRHALVFLILGSIILGWIEQFNAAQYLNYVFAPILKNILGLPAELGSTLIFGFLRKELIIVMANQALGVASLSLLPLSVHQIVVFVIFVTLYFPCFTTMVVIWKEFGAKVAILSGSLSLAVATGSAFIFKTLFDIFS